MTRDDRRGFWADRLAVEPRKFVWVVLVSLIIKILNRGLWLRWERKQAPRRSHCTVQYSSFENVGRRGLLQGMRICAKLVCGHQILLAYSMYGLGHCSCRELVREPNLSDKMEHMQCAGFS